MNSLVKLSLGAIILGAISSTSFAGKTNDLDIIVKTIPLTNKLKELQAKKILFFNQEDIQLNALNEQLKNVISTKQDWYKRSKQKQGTLWETYQTTEAKYQKLYKAYNNKKAWKAFRQLEVDICNLQTQICKLYGFKTYKPTFFKPKYSGDKAN